MAHVHISYILIANELGDGNYEYPSMPHHIRVIILTVLTSPLFKKIKCSLLKKML